MNAQVDRAESTLLSTLGLSLLPPRSTRYSTGHLLSG